MNLSYLSNLIPTEINVIEVLWFILHTPSISFSQRRPTYIFNIIFCYLSEFFWNWEKLHTNIVEEIKSDLSC